MRAVAIVEGREFTTMSGAKSCAKRLAAEWNRPVRLFIVR